MKKKLTTLLLALLLCLGLSAPAFAEDAAPPLQATAYATNKLLWIGPIPLAGLTVINGEYYMPLDLLGATGRIDGPLPLSEGYNYHADKHYILTENSYYPDSLTVMKPLMFAKEGRAIGDVSLDTACPLEIQVVGQDNPLFPNCVYTFGGRYPMVRLKTIGQVYGYREAEDGIHIMETLQYGAYPPVKWEEDLAGQNFQGFANENVKETIRAIHHYIVNTLTHTDFIDSSYFKKNDPDRYARYDRVQQKFTLRNNQTVAWKYGVCQNYSEIFQALCLQAGIPCEIVSSYEMDHAWNRVMLWGQWYHLDATFDDPGPSPTLIQTYFLQTPEQMMRSHLWDDTDYSFPQEYDPAWTQINPKNITSADQFRKCFIGQLAQGKTTISLTVSGPDAYGGYRGPSYWAMQHCALPGWGLSIGYKYSAATRTYTFDVRYT